MIETRSSSCLVLEVDPLDSCLIIQSPHLRMSVLLMSEVPVSQSWSVVRMAAPLLVILLGLASVRGSEEAMTELKRNIFYHYDTNVIPQEVSGAIMCSAA